MVPVCITPHLSKNANISTSSAVTIQARIALRVQSRSGVGALLRLFLRFFIRIHPLVVFTIYGVAKKYACNNLSQA